MLVLLVRRAALGLVLTLAGCSFVTNVSPLPQELRPLVTITATGGHCVEGACRTDTTIMRSGQLTIDGGGQHVVETVDPARLSALAAAVDATDYSVIQSVPFTGECPTAFDGQEVMYRFEPLGRDAVVFSSCEVAIPPNHPLFQALDAVILQSAP